MSAAQSELPPVAPTQEDGFVRGLSELLGGPAGRHAGPGRPRRALGFLLLLTAVTCLLGWVQKSPCRTHPWTHEYQYTRMCYSDTFALYYAEGLADGKKPYVDTPVEYPVLLGGLMGAVAKVTAAATPAARRGRMFFDLDALVLTGAALGLTAATWALAGRRRPWDAAPLAAAPVLVFNAFTNWDLVAAALAGMGLLAWARRRPVLAGLLFGLGTAFKLYPALFLLPLLVLCLRERQLSAWLRAAGAAAITWLVIDVPVWVAYPANFGRFWSLNRSRGADWNSIWLVLEHVRGRPLDPGGAAPERLNLAFAGASLLVAAGVVALALLAPRRPRVAQLAFLLVAGFLLVNKVASPQYVLWVLPLAVLARPRWAALLAWQATEIVTLFFLYYYFVANAHPGAGVDVRWYLTALGVRDAALVALMAVVVWEVWRPERDVVRRSGVDDPAGGVLVPAVG